jgi:DAACS family dicarboxylate/amino acid:cation (Na+ or H+) symporter
MVGSRMLQLPLWLQTSVGMALGLAVGATFSSTVPVELFGTLGKAPIQAIQLLAAPLLFFIILDAVAASEWHSRAVGQFFRVVALNALAALAIALLLVNVLAPGRALEPLLRDVSAVAERKTWAEVLSAWTPSSLLSPFLDNSVPALIVLAIVLGIALRQVEKEQSAAVAQALGFARLGTAVLLRLIAWLLHWIPLAVFAAIAATTARHGLRALSGMGVYLGVCLLGMTLQVLLVHQSWVRASGLRLRRFWSEAREPVLNGFGVNSSLATLPLTLRALDRLGVSRANARLSAAVGTNFNNDGILLYEILAALLLAQAVHGVVPFVDQLGIAFMGLLATLGVAGIPEAGLIALTLVLSATGLPVEAIPIVLSVDWILGRARSAVNVVADMGVAIAIDGRRATP